VEQQLPLRFRSAILACFAETATAVGVDPYALLRKRGIDPRWLDDPELWVPAPTVAALLEYAAAASGRDDFGLLLAEGQGVPTLGPVAVLLAHEGSVKQIIETAVQFMPLISNAIVINLAEHDGSAVMRYDLQVAPPFAQLVDLAVSVGVAALVDSTRGKWRPATMHFRHSAPRFEATFRRFFRCPVSYEEPFDGWTCPAADLAISTGATDGKLAAYARRLLLSSQEMRSSENFSARVASAIYLLIGYGTPALNKVGVLLDMSPRSIQRSLAAEGTTFEAVLNRIRRDIAVHSLANSDMPMAQVGYSAGFSDHSAFSRWFKDAFKRSPTQWRTAARSSQAEPNQS
jgi:AraC-like DNA-binding protein